MRDKLSLNTIIVILFVIVVVMGFGLSYLSGNRPPMMTEEQTGIGEEITDLLPERVESATESANVYYDQSASVIMAEERAQIEQRFVSPLRDYSAMIAGGDPIVTVSVRVGEPEIGGQYLATVSYQSGKVEDLTIARDEDGVMWWKPDCPNSCVYPAEFAKKYPQVIADFSGERF